MTKRPLVVKGGEAGLAHQHHRSIFIVPTKSASCFLRMPRSDADPIFGDEESLAAQTRSSIFCEDEEPSDDSVCEDFKDVLVSSCGGFVVNGCQSACRHKFSRTEHADQLRMRLVMVEGGQTGAHVLAEPRFCTGATEDRDSEAWWVVHSHQMRRLRSVMDV